LLLADTLVWPPHLHHELLVHHTQVLLLLLLLLLVQQMHTPTLLAAG
jgi:hypothetical protein